LSPQNDSSQATICAGPVTVWMTFGHSPMLASVGWNIKKKEIFNSEDAGRTLPCNNWHGIAQFLSS